MWAGVLRGNSWKIIDFEGEIGFVGPVGVIE